MRFEFVDRFLKHLRVSRGLSENTIQAYKHDLKIFTQFLNKSQKVKIENVKKENIRCFIEFLDKRGLSAASKARKIACLKSFFKYLHIEDMIPRNPVNGTFMPKINHKESHGLSEQEAKRLLKVVYVNATAYYKSRDYAIMSLFLNTGIRLSELVNMDRSDVDLIQGTIRITRKGGNQQILPLNSDASATLKKYLSERDDDIPAFFISKRSKRIHKRTVTHLIKKYMLIARLNGERLRLSPHLLRRSFANFILKAGSDIITIQKLMGHRSIVTTQLYLNSTESDGRKAVEQIKIGDFQEAGE